MPKIKKVHRSKSYKYHINRKRTNKKERGTGTIKCPDIRKAWNHRRTMVKNITDMGLSFDSNKTIKIPNMKQERLKVVKLLKGTITEEDLVEKEKQNPVKGYVAQKLEVDANTLRESGFRLPKGVVEKISYMLDTYGLDYKSMVKDKKNYDQETWKQFRAKIKKFISIPEQFGKYLQDRNLDIDNLNWVECDSEED